VEFGLFELRAGELVQDAVAGFVDELAGMCGMLDSRYDDLKSGRVRPIDGEEAFGRLRAKAKIAVDDERGNGYDRARLKAGCSQD